MNYNKKHEIDIILKEAKSVKPLSSQQSFFLQVWSIFV